MSPSLQAAPRSRGWRTPLRRFALVAGVVVALAASFVAVEIGPLLLEPNAYANVASIEREADYRDDALMLEAKRQPVAAAYAAQAYEFQHNQSFCGPTSVADVLHSLGVSKTQQDVLANSPYHAWFGYLLGGLTLDQEADLLQSRAGRPVKILRDLSLDQFREEMLAVNDTRRRYVLNFHRGPLFGRGHGHFSPLLAYLPERDLVLVGDVNADYRPFLVSTDRLWRAADTVDAATGRKRGLLELSTE